MEAGDGLDEMPELIDLEEELPDKLPSLIEQNVEGSSKEDNHFKTVSERMKISGSKFGN